MAPKYGDLGDVAPTLSAREISRVLGNVTKEGRGWRCRCPVHDGVSLNVADGDGGRLLVKCWAGCDPLDILAELRRRGLLGDRLHQHSDDRHRPPREQQHADGSGIISARKILAESKIEPIPYLKTRALKTTSLPTLRLHRGLRHAPTGLLLPAMVGAVQGPNGDIIGIHRTFLNCDLKTKASVEPNRMMLGATRGGAVRLAMAAAAMAIGEGIETCLSFLEMTGIATWAALSTSGLRTVILPSLPLAATITIVADNDPPGEEAAQAAADRFFREGRAVRIARTLNVKDFNDLVLCEAANA